MSKSKGVVWSVIGAVIALIGVILCVCGNDVNNDLKRQVSSFFSSGSKSPTGDYMIFGGGAMIVIGVILIIIGICVYFSASSQQVYRGLNGRYISASGKYSVLFKSDGSCVWSQPNTNYPAKFVKINDGLWNIVIKDFGVAFTITLAGSNLHIKGGPVDEIFRQSF